MIFKLLFFFFLIRFVYKALSKNANNATQKQKSLVKRREKLVGCGCCSWGLGPPSWVAESTAPSHPHLSASASPLINLTEHTQPHHDFCSALALWEHTAGKQGAGPSHDTGGTIPVHPGCGTTSGQPVPGWATTCPSICLPVHLSVSPRTPSQAQSWSPPARIPGRAAWALPAGTSSAGSGSGRAAAASAGTQPSPSPRRACNSQGYPMSPCRSWSTAPRSRARQPAWSQRCPGCRWDPEAARIKDCNLLLCGPYMHRSYIPTCVHIGIYVHICTYIYAYTHTM